MQETDEQAWERIGGRTRYRCGCCASLVASMRQAAETGGAGAAMAVLRNYRGMVCSSVEWMLWPAAPDDLSPDGMDADLDNPGSQAVS